MADTSAEALLHLRFDSMGTVVSVSARANDGPGWTDACDGVERAFRMLDDRFSLYRPESELSRVARGELGLSSASVELRDVYALAIEWRGTTHGAFTPHRPDGVVDLNGVVKALAIERAGHALAEAELEDWCINAGGDVLCHGMADAGRLWAVGVVDPDDRGAMLTSLELFGQHRAVATSGLSERGDHVWPSGRAEPRFVQVTVFAPDIVTADVLATAILAAPATELDELVEGHAADVLAVLPDGGLVVTPGLRERIVS
ncbi:FAD:protein FMN transferase [Parafrigoribacterium soli]|uniref:FAD:protein FMN transferase n=1 Tax=Parafrigoribacterium soli TaxID=3144663 RepID=UPI0032EFDA15